MRGTNEQGALHLLGELLIPNMYGSLYITSLPSASLRREPCLGKLALIKFSSCTVRLWCTAHLPYKAAPWSRYCQNDRHALSHCSRAIPETVSSSIGTSYYYYPDCAHLFQAQSKGIILNETTDIRNKLHGIMLSVHTGTQAARSGPRPPLLQPPSLEVASGAGQTLFFLWLPSKCGCSVRSFFCPSVNEVSLLLLPVLNSLTMALIPHTLPKRHLLC